MNRKLSLVGRELRNSKSWSAGISLLNANGDIDPASLGYQYTIQTTTQIRAAVVKQKFYEVPVAEFFSIVPGTGAWMEEIKTNLVYQVGGAFKTGLINNATGHSQIAQVNVGTAPKTAKINTWAKGYQYTVPEVQKALASDNWDIMTAKMEALKKNWDLGLQEVGFLGLDGDVANTPGLLTNAEVNINLAVITANISSLSDVAFQALVAAILGAYFTNSNSTVLPDTFVIPMSDFLGLGSAASATFPNVTKLEYLTKVFSMITGNPNFKIRGLAYGDAARNAGFVSPGGINRYILYRNDMETVCMDLPVDFQLTPAGTANNFQWQGVGAGQFTGCIFYRPAEALYFDHA